MWNGKEVSDEEIFGDTLPQWVNECYWPVGPTVRKKSLT